MLDLNKNNNAVRIENILAELKRLQKKDDKKYKYYNDKLWQEPMACKILLTGLTDETYDSDIFSHFTNLTDESLKAKLLDKHVTLCFSRDLHEITGTKNEIQKIEKFANWVSNPKYRSLIEKSFENAALQTFTLQLIVKCNALLEFSENQNDKILKPNKHKIFKHVFGNNRIVSHYEANKSLIELLKESNSSPWYTPPSKKTPETPFRKNLKKIVDADGDSFSDILKEQKTKNEIIKDFIKKLFVLFFPHNEKNFFTNLKNALKKENQEQGTNANITEPSSAKPIEQEPDASTPETSQQKANEQETKSKERLSQTELVIKSTNTRIQVLNAIYSCEGANTNQVTTKQLKDLQTDLSQKWQDEEEDPTPNEINSNTQSKDKQIPKHNTDFFLTKESPSEKTNAPPLALPKPSKF